MAEVEEVILSHLFGNATVVNLLGNRIYFSGAPQPVTLPFAAFWRTDGPRTHSLSGTSGLVMAHMAMDIFASTQKNARIVGNAIRKVLDGLRDDSASVSVQGILLTNEADMYDESTEIMRLSQDYLVMFQESIS